MLAIQNNNLIIAVLVAIINVIVIIGVVKMPAAVSRMLSESLT